MRIIAFLLFASSVACAQNIDHNKQDTTGFKRSQKLFHTKPFSTTAVKTSVLLIGTGLLTCIDNGVIDKYEVREERNEHLPDFRTQIDDYLMHAPIIAVYGLNMVGIKGQHDLRNRTLLLLKTELLVNSMTFSIKHVTRVARPDASDRLSFPSGHTAQAFAAATFMAKEYGARSPWYAVGAYGMATTVGAMRILNNKHWVSDVLVGAGIGILATNLVYMTHQYRWKNKNSNLAIMPSLQGGPGLYIGYRFE
jgi:membrane-associated phospholipid phosphatase